MNPWLAGALGCAILAVLVVAGVVDHLAWRLLEGRRRQHRRRRHGIVSEARRGA